MLSLIARGSSTRWEKSLSEGDGDLYFLSEKLVLLVFEPLPEPRGMVDPDLVGFGSWLSVSDILVTSFKVMWYLESLCLVFKGPL